MKPLAIFLKELMQFVHTVFVGRHIPETTVSCIHGSTMCSIHLFKSEFFYFLRVLDRHNIYMLLM